MYSDNHKYFIQFMMKHGQITVKQALKFCETHPIDKVKDLRSLKQFISEINSKITKLDMILSVLKCEVTSVDVVALINTANDEISKLQHSYSGTELEYFQLLLHELMATENHRIKKMVCFNLTACSKSFSKDHMEKLLIDWTNGGYLVEKDYYIYLGPRGIAEFAPYLNAHCRNFYTDCLLCSEAVFTGSVCTYCHKIMHKSCLDKYLTRTNKCPECKNNWLNLNEDCNQASCSTE